MSANYEGMTKAELIEMLKTSQSGQGRKQQVLKALKDGVDTIDAIAEKLNISAKNVSSQLTYLRQDGHKILSVSAGGQSVLLLLSDEDYENLLSKRLNK